MFNRVQRLSRRVTMYLSAGVLLQASGCMFDTSELAAGLVSSVVNNLIASFVFGAFNLGGP